MTTRRLATLLLASLLLGGILPMPVAAAGLPVASADAVTTNEDTAVIVTVTAQDDTGNDPIDSFAVDTPPTNGTLGAFSVPNCTGITPPVCTATVTYTPDANTNGSDSFTFTATDAVADTSAPATASIAVTAVNDAPSFTKGANQVALEDSGAHSISTWATAISAGPSDEVGQVVSFVIDTNDNPGLFSAGPAVSASGTLTYTPTANANGSAAIALHIHDTGGTANGGANTSAIQSFTITVTAVNDPPTATDDTLTVAEDAAATIVNVLGNDSFAPDTGETLSVTAAGSASHGTTSLLSGVVRYAPAANYAGTDSFTYTLSDGNGGTDTGTVNVTVTAVNDAPSFTKGANEAVLEDVGAQAVNGWATALSPGGGVDEAGQTLSFAIDSNGNSSLFSVQPAVSSAGTLSYTPAANANGSATIVLHVADDGGTANGGDDASATQTLVISVTAVNDAPTFTSGGDVSAAEDSGLQTVSGWATAISPGPGESGQAVAFAISNVADPSLFAVQPTIDANGTLTFRAASNRSGLSTLDIVLGDNGGTANGGSNTSAPVTITITISGANDAPIASNDLASVRLTGPTAINVRANDSAGPNEPGDTYLITSVKERSRGIVTITGGGTGLTYDPIGCATGSDTFTYTLTDGGGLTDTATVLVTIVASTSFPTADGPALRFTSGGTVGTTIPVSVAWCGLTSGTTIRSYRLDQSGNGGAYTAVTTATRGTSLGRSLALAPTTYQYRVRVTDNKSRTSAFAYGPKLRVVRYQDSSTTIVYSSGWGLSRSSSFWGGTSKVATGTGRTATLTYTGRGFALIGPRSSTRGSFFVYVDGVKVTPTAISEKSSTTVYRRIVYARTLAQGAHTIRIVTASSARVDLDGIVTFQAAP